MRVACPGIPLNLHPAVAPLFAELIRRVDAIKGPGFMQSSGGKNVRPVRGYEERYARTKAEELLSNHSWGLAADFRAGTNPMSNSLITDMPPNIKQIAADCGLQWGGTWARKDPMHFEFIGTPADAAQAVARLTPDEELPVDVPNPYSGQNEPAAVAIGYAEKRIREGVLADLKAQLPALIAEAVMNAPVTSAVDGKTQAPLRQFIAWIDRATNAVANRKES